MSTIDANRVIFTGENSAIRLSNNDSDSFTTNATFWPELFSTPIHDAPQRIALMPPKAMRCRPSGAIMNR